MEELLAFLYSLIAAVMFNVGVFLQKRGAIRLPKIEAKIDFGVLKAFLMSRDWMLGSILGAVGGIFYFEALYMGYLSLVQIIVNWGIIVLAILSVLFLNERLKLFEWIGVAISITGVSLAGITFETTEKYTFDFPMLSFLIVLCAVLIIVFLIYAKTGKRGGEIGLGLAGGAGFAIGAILLKVITILVYNKAGEFNLLTKSTWLAMFSLDIFPVLVIWAVFNFGGFVIIQAGLQRGRATIVIPINTAMSGTIPVIAGVIVFGESILVPELGMIGQFLRLIGIILTLIGTIFLYRFGGTRE